ncbi:hypothetical protein [Micromonospora chalcea]|uniref:hypothetical protein n=1 Tax=Micromonospora chalcea TaxID=1874 RepID=UPI0037AD0CA6
MATRWDADPTAAFARRLGRSAAELGESGGTTTCPDIWELSNGDVAVIGRDLTDAYAGNCRKASASAMASGWSSSPAA